MNNILTSKKILIATVPTDGHFNPLTGLAKHLQATGYDVRWYTSVIFGAKLNKLAIPHYPFAIAKEVNGNTLHSVIPGFSSATGGEKGKLYLRHLFIDRATEYFEDIRNIYQEFQFDLLIADSMFSAMPLIRHQMHIPVVAIGVVPLIEDSVDTAPAGRALPPATDEQTRAIYADMYRQKYAGISDLVERYKHELLRYNINVTGSFIFDTLVKEASSYLQIGIPGFEYKRQDIGKNVRFIGALLPYPKAQGCGWYDIRLQTYKKIALVTQGTVEGDTGKILEPALTAFAGTDVLVIATTGGHGTAELRKKYDYANVIIEDYISFADVMPYTSVYITNGGYGGTILSIMNGVPMVAAGVHELKNEVCARIAHFGLGIDLKTERPDPDAILAAVREVMKNDQYRENVQTLRYELNQYNGLELCTQEIEQLLLQPSLP